MKNLSILSFVFLSVAAVACGEVVPIGTVDQGVGAGDAGGDVATDAANVDGGVTNGWEIPACEEPSGAVHEYTSIADTEAHLEGAWFLCSGGIGSPADTAGIELSATEAHFLVKSGSALVRGGTWDYDRTVSFIDTTSMNGPGNYQMNLSTSAGTNSYSTRTSEDGRFLELDEGTSAKVARYVRAKPITTGPSCAEPTDPAHAYTSIADVGARITGRWRICDGGITSPADTKGLEFAGAQAYFLVDSGGALVRGTTWDYERDVQILDTTSMNGPGSYQINLKTGAGTNSYFSRISENGDKLELEEGTSAKKVTYVRVP